MGAIENHGAEQAFITPYEFYSGFPMFIETEFYQGMPEQEFQAVIEEAIAKTPLRLIRQARGRYDLKWGSREPFFGEWRKAIFYENRLVAIERHYWKGWFPQVDLMRMPLARVTKLQVRWDSVSLLSLCKELEHVLIQVGHQPRQEGWDWHSHAYSDEHYDYPENYFCLFDRGAIPPNVEWDARVTGSPLRPSWVDIYITPSLSEVGETSYFSRYQKVKGFEWPIADFTFCDEVAQRFYTEVGQFVEALTVHLGPDKVHRLQ